jgi:aconitase A
MPDIVAFAGRILFLARNFPGRSGPGLVWLASPPTVAASAIAGELILFQALQERVAARNSLTGQR